MSCWGDYPDHSRSLTAGMVHMVFHAVLKITLFFCVGAVHYKLHRDFVPDVEGCGVLMPVVFGSFTVAALGLMGAPPLVRLHQQVAAGHGCGGAGDRDGLFGGRGADPVCGAHRPVPDADRSAGLFPQTEPAALRPGAQAGPAGSGLRMTVPITALAAGSVALGLGAGRLAGTVAALLG